MATGADLGLRIKRLRETREWSQKDLARAVGVSHKTVSNWETGHSSPRNRIGKLEAVFGTSLSGPSSDPVFTDPDEAMLWSMTRLRPDTRWRLIDELRRLRAAPAAPAGQEWEDPPGAAAGA